MPDNPKVLDPATGKEQQPKEAPTSYNFDEQLRLDQEKADAELPDILAGETLEDDADAAPVLTDEEEQPESVELDEEDLEDPLIPASAKGAKKPDAEGKKPAAAPAKKPDEKPALNFEDELDFGEFKSTRAKVRDALKDRDAIAKEANGWRQLYGGTIETAQKTWVPFVDGLKNIPGLSDYLEASRRHFVEFAIKEGKVPKALVDRYPDWYDPSKWEAFGQEEEPKDDNERLARLERTFRQSEEQNKQYREQIAAQQQVQQLKSQVDAERTKLVGAHPVLANQDVWDIIAWKAMQRIADGDQSYTLSRSVQDNADWLEKQSRVYEIEAQEQEQPPEMLPAGGATPSGARARVDPRPKKFKSLEAATQEFQETFG
jgi:hypothetical protein